MSQLVIDQYSPLSHKAMVGDGARVSADLNLAPSWVPEEQRRRLAAYTVLAMYRSNSARHAYSGGTLTDRADRREFGDAELIVQRVVSGVLGDEIQIVVDGADEDLPDQPDLPEPPAEPATTGDQAVDGLNARVFKVAKDRWLVDATAIVDTWEAQLESQPVLAARQEWLRAWAETEGLVAKLVEGEGDTVGLGDGVYTFAWSPADTRPVVDVYAPGMYFPVLSDDDRGFPSKVHIAWEFERETAGVTEEFVRRKTWELTTIPGRTDDDGMLVLDERDDGLITLVPQDGDSYDENLGLFTRWYPWQDLSDPDAAPSTLTCVFSDGTWPLAKVKAGIVDALDDDSADVMWNTTLTGDVAYRLDLGIDFVPVVHVPNTPADREHFGVSVLSRVAQILDDLSRQDTNVDLAADLAAVPMLGVFGSNVTGPLMVRPGGILKGGSGDGGGRMDVLDLSGALPAVMKLVDALLERMFVNVQVPAEVAGRVDGASAASGVQVALRFGPFTQLVEFLRLTRHPKWRLMLKFPQRLAQVHGALEPGPTPVARVVPGSFLPSDLNAAVEVVVKLLTANGISRRTGLRLLVDAGVDIGDLSDELEDIQSEDTAGAAELADATGSEQAAADYLGVEIEPAPLIPDITVGVPPAGGAE